MYIYVDRIERLIRSWKHVEYKNVEYVHVSTPCKNVCTYMVEFQRVFLVLIYITLIPPIYLEYMLLKCDKGYIIDE